MIQIPELTTERLLMRAPSLKDHAREVAFYSSPQADFVGGHKNAIDTWNTILSRLGHWAVRGYGFWHLEDQATGQYVGRCGLYMPLGWPEPEIGWSLMGDCTGKGYATEAAAMSRSYAYRTLGWKTAISVIDPDNTASQNVAKRLGATYESAFEHVDYGTMHSWRHMPPEELQ